MSEVEGYADAPGMVWDGSSDPLCLHPLEVRDVTVEGYVGCARCGALLRPEDEVQGIEPIDAQVKYRLEGRLPMAIGGHLVVQGEWDDLETAVHCSSHIQQLGGWAAVTKVTTESATDV